MKIIRRGFGADYGESSIEFNSPEFAWDSDESCISIKQHNVRNFSNSAHHNYTVLLSLTEVRGLLQVISEAAISDPQTFEQGLEPSIKPLIRIQAVAAGVVANIKQPNK